MPVKFEQISEMKSENFEDSDDDEVCVFPPI
jgi:hypothetical protein